MRVHHVGYAVADIDESISAFKALGYVIESGIINDSQRKVRIAFVKKGEDRLELVAALCEGSPVDGVLAKCGSVPYHICFSVDSIDDTYSELKKKGFLMLHKPLAAPAIGSKKVAFVYCKTIGLIELLENPEDA